MTEPATTDRSTDELGRLRRDLAESQAELAEARRAAKAAADAATAARALNVALLAKLDDPSRSPSADDLWRRSAELDRIYASRLWRWSALPRRAARLLRRAVPGRRS